MSGEEQHIEDLKAELYEATNAANRAWAENRALREALASAKLAHAALRMAIDDGDDYGEHVGLQRYRRAVYDGQAEVLERWETAFAAAAGGEE